MADFCEVMWSGREDSNLRPLPPEGVAPDGIERFSAPSVGEGVMSGGTESLSVPPIRGGEVHVAPTTPVLPSRYVYFIQAGEDGPIKIGSAKKPGERLATMQTGNHVELRLIGFAPVPAESETGLHLRFAKHNIRGEWFHPHPDVLAVVEFWRNIERNWRARLSLVGEVGQ